MPRAERDPVFVLVYSPLVGPTTWSHVARELEERGRGVLRSVRRGSDRYGARFVSRYHPRIAESRRLAA